MATNTELVQKLYVAYYNRPADVGGLDFYVKALDAGATVAEISKDFSTGPEYVATYAGKTPDEIINTIYMNLFGRGADKTGLDFWGNELTQGISPLAVIVQRIAAGALNADGTLNADGKVYANKVAASIAFTNEINTVGNEQERVAYASGHVNGLAKTFLAGVTDDTSLAAATAGIHTTGLALVDAYLPPVSTVLTTGVDTLVGTSANDVFTGVVGAVVTGGVLVSGPTLSAADSIDGGAGNNTLKVVDQVGGSSITGYNTTNIQTLSVTSVGDATVNTTSGLNGVTTVNVTQSNGADNITTKAGQTVSVNDSAGVVTIDGASSTQTVTTAGGVVLSGATGAITVTDNLQSSDSTVDDGTNVIFNNTTATAAHTIKIGTASATSMPTGDVVVNQTIAAAKGASVIAGKITVDGGKTVTVTEAVTKNLTTATAAGVANGTTTQSAVDVNGSALTTTVTVNQAAIVTAANSKTAIAAVAETSSVQFGVLKAGDVLTVAGLTLTAAADMTAKEVATAFANLSDAAAVGFTSAAVTGANSDTVVFTSTGSGDVTNLDDASTGYLLTNTSGTSVAPIVTTTTGIASQTAGGKVGVVAGAVNIVDAGHGTGSGTIASVTLSNYGASSAINSDALATLNLSGKSGDLAITDAGTKALDVTLNGLDGANTITVNTGTGQFTTVHLHTTGADSTLAGFADGLTAALTVDGDHNLVLSDASGLSTLKTITVSGSAGLDIVTGLAAVTDVNASATSGDMTLAIDATTATYEGGSGVDTITIAAAPTKAISGGAGTDVLVVNIAGGFNASGNTNISGFETLGLGALATGTYDATGFAHLTEGAVAGNVVFSNVAAGVDLSITASPAATTTYTLKDATGTADSLNLNLVGEGAIDANNGGASQVIAAKIESITINATDTTDGVDAGATVDKLSLVATAAKTVVVSGNTTLELDLTGNTKVTSVDASGMTGGLKYTTAGTIAETVHGGATANTLTAAAGTTADVLIGGAGNDTLTANAGLDTLTGGAGNDTFVIGTASANLNSYATITDATAGDVIQFAHQGVEVFTAAKIALGATAVFQDYANAAINAGGDSSVNAHISWFQYGGDTYVVESLHNATATHDFQNGADVIVKLTGIHDLSTGQLLDTAAPTPTIILH